CKPPQDHHQVEVHKEAGTPETELLIQAVTVLGPLVPYQNAPRISCWVAWRETARTIIVANPHEKPELLSSLYAFMVAENIAKGLGPEAVEWMTLTTNTRQ
ncbi:hypothetical protein, partial [Edaphobacter aggregans]|uniref:hypothetical protein n=1 Tax=Edaphobacter aggregans TaxID=570835 RepID=UPI001B80427A